MHREKMDGVNLREGIMEVAFEQWTERTYTRGGRALIHQCRYRHSLRRTVQVGFNVFPRYREAVADEMNDQERAGQVDSRIGRVQRFSLNSGGNTDEGFALSI